MFKLANKALDSLSFLSFISVGLILFGIFTDPNKLPIAFILLVIIWFYLIVSLLAYHLINLLKVKALRDSKKRQVMYSFFVGLVPTLILMLISVNQFTIKDLLLLLVLGSLLLVYIARFRLR